MINRSSIPSRTHPPRRPLPRHIPRHRHRHRRALPLLPPPWSHLTLYVSLSNPPSNPIYNYPSTNPSSQTQGSSPLSPATPHHSPPPRPSSPTTSAPRRHPLAGRTATCSSPTSSPRASILRNGRPRGERRSGIGNVCGLIWRRGRERRGWGRRWRVTSF